ncbi:MAG: Daple, partial [Actinoplanes sp.]
VPMVRPAAPGVRRPDWNPPTPGTPSAPGVSSAPGMEAARHSLAQNTPVSGPSPRPETVADPPARPSYDPSSFPRRLAYEPPLPVPNQTQPTQNPEPGTVAAFAPPAPYSGFGPKAAEPAAKVLPQRVPAQPDVPRVPDPPLVEPTAETPALARIATHLRRGDMLPVQERQEGFDVQAILAAVREVDGVRDASLRSTPTGAHSLRLDLAEGADPAEVSRQVARLLQDRMGLDAAMKGDNQSPLAAPQPAPSQLSAPAPVAQQPAPTPIAERPAPAPAQAPTAAPAPAVASAPVSPARPAPVSPARPAPVSPAPVRPAPAPAPQQSAAAPVSPSAVVPVAPPRPSPTRPAPARPAPARPAEPEPAERPSAERPTDLSDAVEPSEVTYAPARPLYPNEHPGPRIVIENVHVNTFGSDATVEVRLAVGDRSASGVASGPAVDGYLLRLCAMATAGAVDELLATSNHPEGPPRCFVEHAAAVPFGASQVAVVVLLLSCGGWVEQLAGSAVVTSDDRHAMVRATLAAVNRRLEALLS